MIAIYKQFRQGISVAICIVMSAAVSGYMITDIHKIEKKQIKYDYEKQIEILKQIKK